MTFKELIDWDTFFYYGQNKNNLNAEIESDLIIGVMQSKRTLFYNREFGGAIPDHENYPTGIALTIGLRFDISMHIARENTRVTDGNSGFQDRRIAVSHNSISIKEPETNSGNLDVSILYIPIVTQTPEKINLPIGGSAR